jgi:hypothetical protein
MGNIGGPKIRFETATLVEATDARVLASALKQHVMAVSCPSFGESRLDDGPTMTKPAILGVCHDILQKCVCTPAAEKIWRRYQHASRYDLRACIRNKYGHPLQRQCLGPDLFGPVWWLRG